MKQVKQIFYNPHNHVIIVSRGWTMRPYYATKSRVARLMDSLDCRPYKKQGFYFYPKNRSSQD